MSRKKLWHELGGCVANQYVGVILPVGQCHTSRFRGFVVLGLVFAVVEYSGAHRAYNSRRIETVNDSQYICFKVVFSTHFILLTVIPHYRPEPAKATPCRTHDDLTFKIV